MATRNDEQIQVGVTPGLVAGSSSFIFDGTSGKPDYRMWEIVISEISGTNFLIKGLNYSWNPVNGTFVLLQAGNIFADQQWYHVHFEQFPVQPIIDASNLIDSTYFIRDITIPNIDIIPTVKNAPVLQRLNSFIQKFEPQCLVGILGYPLYQIVLNELSSRVSELVLGAEYTLCGVTHKWTGLIQPTPKISLIADYVYYYFQESMATQTTGTGEAVSLVEASRTVSPGDKMINAWNFFSRQSQDMSSFLWNKKDSDGVRVYPEFTSRQLHSTINFSRRNNIFGI